MLTQMAAPFKQKMEMDRIADCPGEGSKGKADSSENAERDRPDQRHGGEGEGEGEGGASLPAADRRATTLPARPGSAVQSDPHAIHSRCVESTCPGPYFRS